MLNFFSIHLIISQSKPYINTPINKDIDEVVDLAQADF